MNPWPLIGLVAGVTVLIKGCGPAVLGSRALPGPVVRVVALLAASLLAALVVTNALADGRTLHVGADTLGVLAAGLLLRLRAPVVVVVLGAALTTALLRAAGLD